VWNGLQMDPRAYRWANSAALSCISRRLSRRFNKYGATGSRHTWNTTASASAKHVPCSTAAAARARWITWPFCWCKRSKRLTNGGKRPNYLVEAITRVYKIRQEPGGMFAMATAIKLTVLTGPHKDRRFCFCRPIRCQVGRALDCFVQLAGTERDQLISRHHCQLDVHPPVIQVEDLGSSNGTYINGKKVEPKPKGQPVPPSSEPAGLELTDGDLLTIGGTSFWVEIVDCPHVGNNLEGQPAWEGGQPAIRDCSLPC